MLLPHFSISFGLGSLPCVYIQERGRFSCFKQPSAPLFFFSYFFSLQVEGEGALYAETQ